MISILFAAALAAAPSNPTSDAWAACLTSQVERLSAGSGTADQVADQAMRNCAVQELALRRWIERQAGNKSASYVSGEIDKLNRVARGEMRKLAVQIRAIRPAKAAPAAPGRAAARSMAAATDGRAAAREAAMKEDLRFRLFNASSGSITGFAMVDAKGVPSPNWLLSGTPKGPVAAGAFRPLKFYRGSKCTHNAKVTFATGQTKTQPINFCGKNILYVSNQEIWAE